MRDRFKFRHWDKQINKMRYGDIQLGCNGIPFIISPELPMLSQDIDDVITMMCTGLKDKNGKLIYEGDIVRFTEYEIDEIKPEWQYTEIVWGGKYDYPAFDLKDNPFENNGLCELCACGWVVEVVGNIYENEELLDEHKK